ncbi:MAG: metallophosphoesterase [Alphaproteobacteria bacterium]|nr:metallophosphoesterase [Alphaproteobacteria bacterium]MCB9791443.1 metallophosphoesterase [Alphaproteobacteria bacterium]
MAELLAVLADIHGNLEALEAVLADMRAFNPKRVLVLGDTIGYGPEPGACLDRVNEVAELSLIGNHERDALIGRSPASNATAADMGLWTRETLEAHAGWGRLRAAYQRGRRSLREMASARYQSLLLMHAAPDDPLDRYVWPGNRAAFLPANALVDQKLRGFLSFEGTHAFCGHTHVPAVLTAYQHHPIFLGAGRENRAMSFVGPNTVFYVPQGEARVQKLGGVKALINVGSVGQPRDGVAAASYALYDGETVLIRRVAYDMSPTISKIFALDLPVELRQRLVDRLEEAR